MQENQWFQRLTVPNNFPSFCPSFEKWARFKNREENRGNFWENLKTRRKDKEMRKLHYKGRCTRRKLSKCKDICRTYDKVQTVYADWLQANEDDNHTLIILI